MRKKWAFIVALILIIGIILAIIFVNLFKERSTADLAMKVNVVAEENGYLNKNSEEYSIINEYLDKMKIKLNASEDTKAAAVKAGSFSDIYEGSANLIKFLNHDIAFSKYSEVYKKNKKSIQKSLSSASSVAKKLSQEIVELKSLVGESAFLQISTWKNFEKSIDSLFKNTFKAVDKLIDVYISCVNSKVANNDYTKLVLNQQKVYLNAGYLKGNPDSQKSNEFKSMSACYTSSSWAQQYLYNLTLKLKVEDIIEKGEESVYFSKLLNGTLAEV